MDGVVNIDDLRKLAGQRLPKVAYDFVEGGHRRRGRPRHQRAGFPQGPHRAALSRRRHEARPVDDGVRSVPIRARIGIAPTGLAGLFRRGADLMLAEAAREANVPFIMSGSSTASIEALGKLAPDHGWYQLYSAKDQSISEDMIKRAGDAGLKTLVFTVDVPEGSNRERNTRNGWGRPLKLSLEKRVQAADASRPG